jgi:hypothetical protein
MQKQVEQLRVFGGICCDFEVGGLNPAVAEVALAPAPGGVDVTFSSIPDRRKPNLLGPGIALLDERAKPISPVHRSSASRARCRRRDGTRRSAGALRSPTRAASSRRW